MAVLWIPWISRCVAPGMVPVLLSHLSVKMRLGNETRTAKTRKGKKKLGRGEDDHKRPGKNPNFPKMCEKMPTAEEKKRDTNSTFQLKSLQVKHKVAQRLKSVHKITELKGRQSSWIISAE